MMHEAHPAGQGVQVVAPPAKKLPIMQVWVQVPSVLSTNVGWQLRHSSSPTSVQVAQEESHFSQTPSTITESVGQLELQLKPMPVSTNICPLGQTSEQLPPEKASGVLQLRQLLGLGPEQAPQLGSQAKQAR